jgi:hypothetical protein
MPENTSRRDPMTHFAGAMGQGTSDYIEGMEAAGQKQLVAEASTMPAKGDWAALKELGFGDPEPTDDDLFVKTTLPKGWSKRATSHSMWSEIVDGRGVVRVNVFYKAAFYDRDAHFQVSNVGYKAAMNLYYADDKEAVRLVPEQWDLFTEAEQDEYVQSLGAFRRDLEESRAWDKRYNERSEHLDQLAMAVKELREQNNQD